MFNYKELDSRELNFISVASVDELREGERLFVEIEGAVIAVFYVGGEYYAIADVCSHDDGPVAEGELEGYEIVCPRHGARFDVRTGEVRALPAAVDIPAYAVRIEGEQIKIGIPREA